MVKSKEKGGKLLCFPKLMILDKGLIVLFTNNCKGTVIKANSENEIGDVSDTWNTSVFTDYKGTIELTNVTD